ncbi:MAG: anaerobic ribonucleoside-triphosphate reductase activating protein [Candidatus Nanoarchaeia archaeon]|nr:anaerobic ribonucleoside-triphosphate reductase activating protein [Candidatus Nanoarchaeia archaeon]
MTIYENIKGFIPTSLVDWEGKVASVIFVSGCNFRCGFCSNKELVLTPEKPKTIKFEDIKKYLLKNADFIDGVVISGGEPTLQRELALFCEEIKKLGFMVKLDSNGSHPEVLKILKEKKLVDYAAMDIKVVKEKYEEITNNKTDLGKIEESMKIISEFPGYEFRTTVVPVYRKNGEISFMTTEEVCGIAKWIVSVTGGNNHKYFLQPFVPRENGLVDSRLESFPETPKKLLKEMEQEARKHLPNTKIR